METVNRILLALAVFATVVSCQVPAPGKCPSGIVTVQEFDVEKYLGVWYEHSKYPTIFETDGKCVQAEYGLFENGSVSVVNTQVSSKTGIKETIEGSADLTEEIGKLVVKFPSVGKTGIKSNYWVLSTDYSSYSVVYSCTEVENLHAKIVWILTRERNAPQDLIEKAYGVMDSNKISKKFLVKTDQENC